MVSVVLLMGGRSYRFGKDKLFVDINGKQVWQICLEKFIGIEEINCIVIVGSKVKEYLSKSNSISTKLKLLFADPGQERMFSVYNGLCRLKETMKSLSYVLIHDGARPAVSRELILRVINCVKRFGACVPVLPLSFTVKQLNETRDYVSFTLPRENLVEVQTPQAFDFEKLFFAYQKALDKKTIFTDDSSVWETFVKDPVRVCKGERRNIKLTYLDDLVLLKALL